MVKRELRRANGPFKSTKRKRGKTNGNGIGESPTLYSKWA